MAKKKAPEVDQAAAQAPEKPAWTFKHAPDVERVADEIIKKHRRQLNDAEILYLFTTKKKLAGGREIPGQTVKLNPLMRFLEAGPEAEGADFIVILNWDWWLGHTAIERRRAQVHHLLAYCELSEEDRDGNRKWMLARPDVAEFTSVVKAEGKWNDELVMFGDALVQLPLPMDGVRQDVDEEEAENARAPEALPMPAVADRVQYATT